MYYDRTDGTEPDFRFIIFLVVILLIVLIGYICESDTTHATLTQTNEASIPSINVATQKTSKEAPQPSGK